MDKLNAEIVSFSNTNYFIYNENNVKIYPTKVDSGSTSITAIIPTDIIVENNNYDDLLLEFNQLGFIMPSGNTEIVKWHLTGKTFQIYLTHDNGTRMILAYPSLMEYMTLNNIDSIYESEGIYIYLIQLYNQHYQIFKSYRARMLKRLEDGSYADVVEEDTI